MMPIGLDGDGVADGDRAALHTVGAQDRDVRLVDDRRRRVAGERAGIGDRERRARISLLDSSFARAAAAFVAIWLAIPRMFKVSASLTTGTTSPCSSRSTATPRFLVRVKGHRLGFEVDRRVDRREFATRHTPPER